MIAPCDTCTNIGINCTKCLPSSNLYLYQNQCINLLNKYIVMTVFKETNSQNEPIYMI